MYVISGNDPRHIYTFEVRWAGRPQDTEEIDVQALNDAEAWAQARAEWRDLYDETSELVLIRKI